MRMQELHKTQGKKQNKKQKSKKLKKDPIMCKIFGITNFSKIPREELDKHLLKIRDIVCLANNDGFGYALSFKDEVFTEKFVKPSDFEGMLKAQNPAELEYKIFDTYWDDNQLAEGKYYVAKGESPQPVLALVAHGRTSTNFKGRPEYSHPFYNKATKSAFIHNGVMRVPFNHTYDTQTNNDSEYLANLFWDKGLEGVKNAPGYFAFMNLKPGGVVEVVKDDFAQLYGAYCFELDGYIFATTEYMISNYARDFNFKTTRIVKIVENSYAQVQGKTISGVKMFKRTVEEEVTLSAKEESAFKDYRSHGSSYSGPNRDYYKGKQTPATIPGAHIGAGKTKESSSNGTQVSGEVMGNEAKPSGGLAVINGAGKKMSTSHTRPLSSFKDFKNESAGEFSFKASTGRVLHAWMLTSTLTPAELNELKAFEDALFMEWSKRKLDEIVTAKDKPEEDRAFQKKLFSKDEMDEAIKNQSTDPFYNSDQFDSEGFARAYCGID